MQRETTLDYSAGRISEDDFSQLCLRLATDKKISTLIISQKALSEGQKEVLYKIINSNENKGIKLVNEQGEPVGPLYTNWSAYNEEKKDAA